jgi:hypothetical protein
LQHALEIARAPEVQDASTMAQLYRRSSLIVFGLFAFAVARDAPLFVRHSRVRAL